MNTTESLFVMFSFTFHSCSNSLMGRTRDESYFTAENRHRFDSL